MEQEQKQSNTTVEVLKKLISKTGNDGDYLVYRSEIEKSLAKMTGLLTACREIAGKINKQ